jgi:hypothetical protein
MSSLKFTDGTPQVEFSGATTTILATYAPVAQAEIELRSRAQILVNIDYTKGAETSLEIRLEFSPDVDYPVAQPATGTDYYVFSACAAGVITLQDFQVVLASGAAKYRLPVPLLHQERIMRISVKRTGGADATAGSIKLRVIDDAHPVTSSFAARQP